MVQKFTPMNYTEILQGQGDAQPAREPQESYREFGASELYCNRCKCSMPVREKLLLTLPTGNLYDYLCTGCGESLGTKQN